MEAGNSWKRANFTQVRRLNSARLDLVFSLHEAFYIDCTEAGKHEQVRLLIQCMDQACEDILGKQVKIPKEVNVYDPQDGYHDPRPIILMRY